MKVSELIAQLEDYVDDENDPEVRIAAQPSWPLQSTVRDDVVPLYGEDGEVAVVYVAEESQLSGGRGNDSPYVPSEVSRELGWR
jgi:hypothetical protein